ncbi:MAG: hypothetical protein WCE63_21400 [Acidobacteriaceae bacterium]
MRIDNYINIGDEIRVVYRSLTINGFSGHIVAIGNGEPGTREFILQREDTSSLHDGIVGVREDRAIFSVRRGDTWVCVPPLLSQEEAETKSKRNAINEQKRVQKRLPLFAVQIESRTVPADRWIASARLDGEESLQRDHDSAMRATVLRDEVRQLVSPEDYTVLVAACERFASSGTYEIYFWQKQLAHRRECGRPDIFTPSPCLTARLSLPWLKHDAQLTWKTAPGGPQPVRVLFIGSGTVMVHLVGEPIVDYDPRLIHKRNNWIAPEDFAESALPD